MASDAIAQDSAITLTSRVHACPAPYVLTSFQFLNLLPELQLKVLEHVVRFESEAIFPRELMPVRRSENFCCYHEHEHQEKDKTRAQPAITKVSRRVREDSLMLYYSKNLFVMVSKTIQLCAVSCHR